MTRFVDGPAEGVTLMLRRAPFFLRAVRAADGEWDALDQLEDQPSADETVVVYQLHGEPSSMHICNRGRGARSGWYRGGEYRLASAPPSDEVARDNAKWERWAMTEGPKRGFAA